MAIWNVGFLRCICFVAATLKNCSISERLDKFDNCSIVTTAVMCHISVSQHQNLYFVLREWRGVSHCHERSGRVVTMMVTLGTGHCEAVVESTMGQLTTCHPGFCSHVHQWQQCQHGKLSFCHCLHFTRFLSWKSWRVYPECDAKCEW